MPLYLLLCFVDTYRRCDLIMILENTGRRDIYSWQMEVLYPDTFFHVLTVN